MKAEPFEYAETITTILRKLKKQFPTISFSIDVEGWVREWEKDIIEPITYKIWDTRNNMFAYSTISLIDAYNQKLEQLKNV